jgi:hypothetical protein
MHEPFVVLFPLIPLPNPGEKGLNFGVFVVLVFVVIFAELLRDLLILRVLVDHEVFLLSPKSCLDPWSVSGDRELVLEELTRRCCSS